MPGIDVSLDHLPLVWITNHEGTTDADYVALLGTIAKLVERGEKFVVITEATGFAFPGPSQRKIIADWIPSVKGRMNQFSLGTAMVLQNALQRGSITALNWIARPDVPMAAFETKAEALAWCKGQLEKAGVPIPPNLARLFTSGGESRRVG